MFSAIDLYSFPTVLDPTIKSYRGILSCVMADDTSAPRVSPMELADIIDFPVDDQPFLLLGVLLT